MAICRPRQREGSPQRIRLKAKGERKRVGHKTRSSERSEMGTLLNIRGRERGALKERSTVALSQRERYNGVGSEGLQEKECKVKHGVIKSQL